MTTSVTATRNAAVYYMSVNVRVPSVHVATASIPPNKLPSKECEPIGILVPSSELSLLRTQNDKNKQWTHVAVTNNAPNFYGENCRSWTTLFIKDERSEVKDATSLVAGCTPILPVKHSHTGENNHTQLRETKKLKNISRGPKARPCVSPDSGIWSDEVSSPYEFGGTCEPCDENAIISGVAAEMEISGELPSEDLAPAQQIVGQSARKVEFLSLLGLCCVDSRAVKTPRKCFNDFSAQGQEVVSSGSIIGGDESLQGLLAASRQQSRRATYLKRNGGLDWHRCGNIAALNPSTKLAVDSESECLKKRRADSMSTGLPPPKKIKENVKDCFPEDIKAVNSGGISTSPGVERKHDIKKYRDLHIFNERRRRQDMKTSFIRLQDKIPELKHFDGKNVSKISILVAARRYCRKLFGIEEELIAEKEFLIQRNRRLREDYINAKKTFPDESETVHESFSWLEKSSTSAIESCGHNAALVDHSYSTLGVPEHRVFSQSTTESIIENQVADDSASTDADVFGNTEVDVVGLDECECDSLKGAQQSTGTAEVGSDESDCEFRIISVHSLATDQTQKLTDYNTGELASRTKKRHVETLDCLPRCSRLCMQKLKSAKNKSKQVLLIKADYSIAEPLSGRILNPIVEHTNPDFNITNLKRIVSKRNPGAAAYHRSDVLRRDNRVSETSKDNAKVQVVSNSRKHDTAGYWTKERVPDSLSSKKTGNPEKDLFQPEVSKSISHYGCRNELHKSPDDKSAQLPTFLSHAREPVRRLQYGKRSAAPRSVATDSEKADVSGAGKKPALSKNTGATYNGTLLVHIGKQLVESLSIIENATPTVKLERLKILPTGDGSVGLYNTCDVVTPKPIITTEDDLQVELWEPKSCSTCELTMGKSKTSEIFTKANCQKCSSEGSTSLDEGNSTIDQISEIRKMLRQKEADLEKIRKSMLFMDDFL